MDDLERYTVFEAGQDADPEGHFFDQFVDDQILAAIDTVADDFREVLVLSDIEGLSYAEIAHVTGVPSEP